jgi:hypothetical protein
MKEFYIENVIETGRREEDGVGSIEVGDNIKVVLRLYTPVEDIDAERLWFKVTQINDGKLLAELDNDPLYIKSISGTDALEFNESNVLEVLINKDEQAQINIGDSSEFTGKYTQEEEEQQVTDFMMRDDDGASLFEALLNSNVTQSPEHDLLGALASGVSSDSTTATASDTSLFASEQAYCEKALGFLKTIGKTSGQTIQYDTLPDGTLSLVAPEELRRRFAQLRKCGRS